MKINLSNIPTNPGCYLYKDNSGKVIYVGKAKNLKKRVSSYFVKKDHDPKTSAMISHINDVDFIITNSEVEALILENNLIKKYNPKYNIDLKDSKKYAYIEISNEEYPRLLIARTKNSKGKFFGPFVSGQSRDYILYLLKRIFKIRTCKVLPKKVCLKYHIGLCDAPCTNNITKKEYQEKIEGIKMILNGRTSELIKQLEEKMKQESTKQNFEKALEIKKQIEALLYLKDKQMMERQKKYDEDIINFVVKNNKVYLILFNVYKGVLENKQDFELDYTSEFLEEFLTRYYSENPIPKEIIIPKKVSPSIEEYLKQLAKIDIKIVVPEKGDKKNLLELVKKNIELFYFGDIDKLNQLKDDLNLDTIPFIIECFDISHLSGTSTVASMVQFKNGKPNKENYRRFQIKTIEGIDDFAAMKEVVFRRYYRLVKENSKLPDLILIDGGLGQLHSALEALDELKIKVPTIALAKREEEIYIPERSDPIKLSKKNKALLLLISIRDEAHRFAINYQRLKRKKRMFE